MKLGTLRRFVSVVLAIMLLISTTGMAEGLQEIDLAQPMDAEDLPTELEEFDLMAPEPDASDFENTVETTPEPEVVEAEPKTSKQSVPETLVLTVKDKYTLNTKGLGKNLTFKSSMSKVASVSEKGVITAKKKGTATITVLSKKKEVARCTVTVLAAPDKVSLGMKKISIGVKEKIQLNPVVANGAKATFTWSSKNKKIASVDKKGIIKGVKKGKTTITVKTQNGKKATLTVTVLAAPKKVTIDSSTLYIDAGIDYKLSATLPNKTASQLTWSSSNPSVARVDENGRVTALKAGEAKVTAKTFNGKKASCSVIVSNPATPDPVAPDPVAPDPVEPEDVVQAITLLQEQKEWKVGDELRCKISEFIAIIPESIDYGILEYYSTNTDVATVSIEGDSISIKMVGEGESQIVTSAKNGVQCISQVCRHGQ